MCPVVVIVAGEVWVVADGPVVDGLEAVAAAVEAAVSAASEADRLGVVVRVVAGNLVSR